MKPPPTLDQLVASYPAEVQALTLAARKAILKWLPKVEESIDASAPVVSYGFGPGYRGMVCTLILSKTAVKLGVVRGSELADPRGLLAGSGRVHRYIQLRTSGDVQKPGVSELVKASFRAWKARA